MNPFRRQGTSTVPVRAEAPDTKRDGAGVATLRLYDAIDSEGGDWGVSAKEFARTVDAIPDDTPQIRLLVNSPGGNYWESLAILNSLRSHPAKVVAVVEGLAASGASLVAAGADELHMMPNSELMIHKAWGLGIGNADDFAKLATDLTHADRNQADIYASKAGGAVEDWLTAMSAETWYSAGEAVEAGLADKVLEPPKSGEDGRAQAQAKFDLSIFAHASRDDAPAPFIPEHPVVKAGEFLMSASAVQPHHHTPLCVTQGCTQETPGASVSGSTQEGGSAVEFTAEQINDLRSQVGASEDADTDTVYAALKDALSKTREPAPAASGEVKEQPRPKVSADGTVTLDAATYDAVLDRVKALEKDQANRRAEEGEKVVDQAIKDGRFASFRRDFWLARWAKDPEGTRETIETLPKNSVPVADIGYAGDGQDDDAISAEFAGLFPPVGKGA